MMVEHKIGAAFKEKLLAAHKRTSQTPIPECQCSRFCSFTTLFVTGLTENLNHKYSCEYYLKYLPNNLLLFNPFEEWKHESSKDGAVYLFKK